MAAMLRLGSTGSEVTKLQKALNQAGRSARPKLVEDGSFGEKTQARVGEFQVSRGLPADGVAGPATQAALGMTGASAAPGGAPGGVVGGSVGGDLASDVVRAVGTLTRCGSFRRASRASVSSGRAPSEVRAASLGPASPATSSMHRRPPRSSATVERSWKPPRMGLARSSARGRAR